MPHTKSAAHRLRLTEKRRTLNRGVLQPLKAAVREVNRAVAVGSVGGGELDQLFREAQSRLLSAADRGYLTKNKANRTVAKLAEKVRAVVVGEPTRINERKREKLCRHLHFRLDDMKWLNELDQFLAATATPSAHVEAFQIWLNWLHTTHPNVWVAYAEGWDEAADAPKFRVLNVFRTQKEAVGWTRSLPDGEREHVTVHFTDIR